jgi:hypothetical protein
MAESTVKGLMYCKLNIELDFLEFYEKIKNNKSFLKRFTLVTNMNGFNQIICVFSCKFVSPIVNYTL